jgi:hypothetical protein
MRINEQFPAKKMVENSREATAEVNQLRGKNARRTKSERATIAGEKKLHSYEEVGLKTHKKFASDATIVQSDVIELRLRWRANE